jgi:glycine/D-amino acid oxidase-like deaminating enzyme
MTTRKKIVICGAGIAGISLAYSLSNEFGLTDILLVDERAPLSLTSDKSTECYRNWWPGPGTAMVALMDRSIDRLQAWADQSQNTFLLNQRGYLYVSADPDKIPGMLSSAQAISSLGAGELRLHRSAASSTYQPAHPEGYAQEPPGADLILDPALIRQHFPYLSETAVAALHARRCGWFSAQQLGMYLLDQSRRTGVELKQDSLVSVDSTGGRVKSVHLASGETIPCDIFVNAAGPLVKKVGRMLDVDLPVYSELHLKVSFKDTLGAVPRHAPLVIWTDPQYLNWTAEEREFLAEDPETAYLVEEMPGGAHTRPEGGGDSQIIVLLWEYKTEVPPEPVFPLPLDAQYPELSLRGMATGIPALAKYIGKLSRPWLDGGYYTRTSENRFLASPLPVEGAYVLGAFSGYGLMAAPAAGELLARYIAGAPLPAYAPAFSLDRYEDPAYLKLMDHWGESGQL